MLLTFLIYGIQINTKIIMRVETRIVIILYLTKQFVMQLAKKTRSLRRNTTCP